jgi:hypothetical protein
LEEQLVRDKRPEPKLVSLPKKEVFAGSPLESSGWFNLYFVFVRPVISVSSLDAKTYGTSEARAFSEIKNAG